MVKSTGLALAMPFLSLLIVRSDVHILDAFSNCDAAVLISLAVFAQSTASLLFVRAVATSFFPASPSALPFRYLNFVISKSEFPAQFIHVRSGTTLSSIRNNSGSRIDAL